MPDVLWTCEACRMIGTEAEATAHRIARGHDVEALDQVTSDAVRAEWVPSNLAADLIRYARRARASNQTQPPTEMT